MDSANHQPGEAESMLGFWRSHNWAGPGKLTIKPDSLRLGWVLVPDRLRFSVERADVLGIWHVGSWSGPGFGLHTRSGAVDRTIFSPFHLARCAETFSRLGWPVHDEPLSLAAFRRVCGDYR
jgi:hypothetical protein